MRHPFVALFLLICGISATYLSLSQSVMFWPVAPDERQLVEEAAAREAAQLEQWAKRVMAVVLLAGAIGALLPSRRGTVLAMAGAVVSLAAGVFLIVHALFLDQSAWRFLTYLLLLPPAIAITVLSLVALWALSRHRVPA